MAAHCSGGSWTRASDREEERSVVGVRKAKLKLGRGAVYGGGAWRERLAEKLTGIVEEVEWEAQR